MVFDDSSKKYCFLVLKKLKKSRTSQLEPMVLRAPNHQKSLIFLVSLSKTNVFELKKLKKIKNSKILDLEFSLGLASWLAGWADRLGCLDLLGCQGLPGGIQEKL